MNRIFRKIAIGFVGLGAVGVAAAEDFAVVALPDTQFYSQDYPQTFTAQTQWIAANLATRNIRFVSHLGDLVNEAATPWQWDNAEASMTVLDSAGVPYGTCVGNHDILYPGDYFDPAGTNYLGRFGPQFYQGQGWYGGASPSGLSNYQVITVGGRSYLFLHLLIETPPAELAWAQEILNANRDKPTWIATHRYLFDWRILGQGRYDAFNYTFEPPYRPDGISADAFYRNFVAANRQVYLVHCGHNDGEYRQTSTSNFGLTVHEVLADYQNTYGNGGNGWLRVLTFRPDLDRIDVETYSPTLDDFRTGGESQFSLAVDFDAYTSPAPFIRVQEGLAGYAGTVDTWINQDSPGSSYGGSGVIVVDDDTANSWFNDYQGQGLLRFDGLIQAAVQEGDPQPTAIPLGATITNATLTLNLADDTELGNPQFFVYRMTSNWSEGSTWNSLGGGVDVGSETDPAPVASFSGDNDPDNDFSRALTVTSAVQTWAAGAANHGFALIPEPVDFNDDGIEIHSSEAGDGALRPSLAVEFRYTVANVPPTVDVPLQTAANPVAEGTLATLTVGAVDPNPLDPLVFRLDGQQIGFATGAGAIDHDVLFEDDGSYAFSATVSDDEVTVPAGMLTVIVQNVDPVIDTLTPDRTVDRDRVFIHEVQASDAGPLDVLSYAWDLDGDAAFDDANSPAGFASLETLGPVDLGVEVRDDDGGLTTGGFTVTVADLPADGDFDSNGVRDSFDTIQLLATMGGPDQPVPAVAGFTTANALSAFDVDEDGDIDLRDFAALQ